MHVLFVDDNEPDVILLDLGFPEIDGYESGKTAASGPSVQKHPDDRRTEDASGVSGIGKVAEYVMF